MGVPKYLVPKDVPKYLVPREVTRYRGGSQSVASQVEAIRGETRAWLKATFPRWDFRMVSKQSRTWIEEKDYEFDIWLNLRPSSTVKGLRLIVTPFRKSCSEQDVRIQRYSHCNNDAGRCHNTQLFCKQLVKCGTLDQESWDRACTDQFKESDGMQLPLAIIVAVFSVIAITFLGLGAK